MIDAKELKAMLKTTSHVEERAYCFECSSKKTYFNTKMPVYKPGLNRRVRECPDCGKRLYWRLKIRAK